MDIAVVVPMSIIIAIISLFVLARIMYIYLITKRYMKKNNKADFTF